MAKLVEILALEMEEWPEGVTHLTQSAVDREIYNAQDGKDTDSLESLEPRFDAIKSHDERGKYPIVTRAQWQAERDKQKGGEWKRHRGGKQPVADGVTVDVKFNDGTQRDGKLAEHWEWRKEDADPRITQYRIISQPQAEEVEMIHSQESLKRAEINLMGITEGTFTQGPISLDNEVIYPAGPEWHTDQIDGPLAWRDTIIHCQAIIEDCEREIERNTLQLAAEGFLLIAPITDVRAVDMNDWRNWKDGDKIRMTADDWCDLSKGEIYEIIDKGRDYITILDDVDYRRKLDIDGETMFDDGRLVDFEFVSSP